MLPERILLRFAILCVTLFALFQPRALASDASNWRKLTEGVSEAVSRSDYTNAADKVVQALAISEKFGQGDRRYADNLAAWAYINMQLQNYGASEVAYQRLVRADMARFGTNDVEVAAALLRLADVQMTNEPYAMVDETIAQASNVVTATAGRRSGEMAICFWLKGNLCLGQSNYVAAEWNYTNALALLKNHDVLIINRRAMRANIWGMVLQPHAPAFYLVLWRLGGCYVSEKRLADGEFTFQEALKSQSKAHITFSSDRVQIFLDLAAAYELDHKLPEAEDAARHASKTLRGIETNADLSDAVQYWLIKILAEEGKPPPPPRF